MLLILALMIGVFLWGGLEGLRRGYGFGKLFLRFLIIGLGPFCGNAGMRI